MGGVPSQLCRRKQRVAGRPDGDEDAALNETIPLKSGGERSASRRYTAAPSRTSSRLSRIMGRSSSLSAEEEDSGPAADDIPPEPVEEAADEPEDNHNNNEPAEYVCTTVDNAITAIGLGPFQLYCLFICGSSYMCDAIETTLLTFLYSCLTEQWDLSSWQSATIVSCVFGGELVGCLISGPVSDIYGRKPISIAGAGLVAFAGLGSAFSNDFTTFIILRSLVGVGIGCFAVPFDLLMEFQPSDVRGQSLMLFQLCWPIGSLFCVGMAWAFLYSDGWRVLVVIVTIPCFISFIGLWFTPESPHWLASERGRKKEAEAVLYEIADWNNVIGLNVDLEDTAKDEHANLLRVFLEVESRRRMLASLVIWVAAGFLFYGISLLIVDLSSEDDDNCTFDFGYLFGIYSLEFVGLVGGFFVIDSWGRIPLQVFPYLITAVCMFFVGMLNYVSTTSGLVFCAIALISINLAFTVTWIGTPELFAINVRSTTHTTCSAAARVGAFFCSYWVGSYETTLEKCMLLMFASLTATACSYMLPETSGKALP